MIDKKPFRVTNEQARMLAKLDCTSDLCERCSAFALCEDADFTTVAADLLDARELIDKQEALIKEMRKELEDARAVMEKYEAQLTGELFNDPSLNAILEKTKDYA